MVTILRVQIHGRLIESYYKKWDTAIAHMRKTIESYGIHIQPFEECRIAKANHLRGITFKRLIDDTTLHIEVYSRPFSDAHL